MELKEAAATLPEKEGMKGARDEVAEDEAHALKFESVAPRKLHVQLTRARSLPVKDTAMLVGKGSSGPFVELSVYGQLHKSTAKKRSLGI